MYIIYIYIYIYPIFLFSPMFDILKDGINAKATESRQDICEKAKGFGVMLVDVTAVPRITSSQAKVAGHRAVIEAAGRRSRWGGAGGEAEGRRKRKGGGLVFWGPCRVWKFRRGIFLYPVLFWDFFFALASWLLDFLASWPFGFSASWLFGFLLVYAAFGGFLALPFCILCLCALFGFGFEGNPSGKPHVCWGGGLLILTYTQTGWLHPQSYCQKKRNHPQNYSTWVLAGLDVLRHMFGQDPGPLREKGCCLSQGFIFFYYPKVGLNPKRKLAPGLLGGSQNVLEPMDYGILNGVGTRGRIVDRGSLGFYSVPYRPPLNHRLRR